MLKKTIPNLWSAAACRRFRLAPDMIPFGHIGIRCTIAGRERQTRFTKDEQVMLMSLWALAPSPLMPGNNLPGTDEWTLSLLTNDEVRAIKDAPH